MAKPEVLIIEDSPSLALGYAAQLEEAGYAITVAGTLAEAREALRGRGSRADCERDQDQCERSKSSGGTT